MNSIDAAIKTIAAAEQRVGVQALAAAAGLAPTTVYSLKSNGWSHRSLKSIKALLEAAERLNAANDTPSQERAA